MSELSELSRKELISVINQMKDEMCSIKEENISLKTELHRSRILGQFILGQTWAYSYALY